MKKELSDKLFKKYPKLLNRDILMFGTECWNGWYDLLDKLCSDLQSININNTKQIIVTQIKEKFGGLRFYINSVDNNIRYITHRLINRAEEESYKICEICGSEKDITITTGWIMVRCKDCLGKTRWEERQKIRESISNEK